MLVFGGVTFLSTEVMMEITSVFSDTKGLGELSDEAGNSWEENQHELKGQFTRCLETKKWSSKWDLFFFVGIKSF